MFIATLRINRSLQTVFFSLTFSSCFWSITEVDSQHGAGEGRRLGGLFVGLSAMYGSIAQILNEVYGRVVLPIGPAK